MDYEARMDARNEYIAEQIRENTPDESEYTMDEDILENIKDGVFDIAVLRRTVAILTEHGLARRHIEELLEELKDED